MDPYIGQISLMALSYAPKGWRACDGTLLPISQNQALFSILGTYYGGDGMYTFALPDLRSRIPVHAGHTQVPGEVGGEERHTLLSSEMPAHTHLVTASSNRAGSATPANNYFASSAGGSFASAPDAQMSPQAVHAVGSSQSHENMPPFLALNFFIAVTGIFPSRS